MVDSAILERCDKIVKPSEDKREYLGLKLKNSLQILLISDPETDIAASSLSVHVGSMSDPPDCLGLAHFLEHMLFMGTQKYPLENEYDKYLSQHGGCSNAVTYDNATTFFFEVATEFLDGALDRFSQFFISPLMNESAVTREMEAVHSEDQKNIENDEWRLNLLEKSLSQPDHDYFKFNVGNLTTLRDIPQEKGINVREELLKFHDKWHSANIMTLVILGKDSLDELIKMVVPKFAPIVNNNVTLPVWDKHPFQDSLMKQICVVPIKEKRTIKYLFKYPDDTKYYKSGPGAYLANVIGYEGKGSLLSELKDQGYCSALYSCLDPLKGFGFFSIVLEVTEEGLKNADKIHLMVFQFINMLKEKGPQQYLFEQEAKINKIKFNYLDKQNPMSYVEYLSTSMINYAIEDVLSAKYLLEEYRPELISEMLSYLTPENCNIFLICKSFTGKTNLKEKYYGAEHTIEDINKELFAKLKNSGLNEKFTLPEKNELIPSEFDILRDDFETDESKDKAKMPMPKQLFQDALNRVWYCKDNYFLKPKVFFSFKISNPLAYSSPFYANANSMFALVFYESLNEYLYDANMAGLYFTILTTNYGANMCFSGYGHKMDIFIKRVLEHMMDFKVCPKLFDIIKEKHTRSMKSYKTQKLYNLSNYYIKMLTREIHWSYDDLIDALDKITVQSVEDYIKFFFSTFKVETLAFGNINTEMVKRICKMFEETLVSHYKTIPLPPCTNSLIRNVALDAGCNYRFVAINDVQSTKISQVYFEVCFDDLAEQAKLMLVQQILQEPCFNCLRTNEALGYIIMCYSHRYTGVGALNILVQSDYCTKYLDSRIEAFLHSSLDEINSMSEEDFKAEKESLVSKLLKKKKSMASYLNELFSEICDEEYNFKRKEIYSELVKKIEKDEFIQFFKKHFGADSPDRKKLAVHIIKSDANLNGNIPAKCENLSPCPPLKDAVIINECQVYEFKNKLPLHPLPFPSINDS